MSQPGASGSQDVLVPASTPGYGLLGMVWRLAEWVTAPGWWNKGERQRRCSLCRLEPPEAAALAPSGSQSVKLTPFGDGGLSVVLRRDTKGQACYMRLDLSCCTLEPPSGQVGKAGAVLPSGWAPRAHQCAGGAAPAQVWRVGAGRCGDKAARGRLPHGHLRVRPGRSNTEDRQL